MKILNRLKKGLAFLIAAALLLSVLQILPKAVRAAEVVTIPDDALRAAICEKFNVSDEEITKEKLEQLTSLSVTYAVSDLTGIENCTSLQHLSFMQKSDTELDLTPLENLSALTELTMHNGNVSGIPRIQNLSVLVLIGCKIEDTASIFNLTGLTKLSCYSTEIAEISDCSGMSSLQSITVDHSASLTDISGISGCNSLRSLYLSDCYNLTDISPLSGLGLTYLSLESVEITPENQTSYMETIATLSELEYLNLSFTGLNDTHVSMFDSLTSLEELNVKHNNLTNAEFLVSHKDTLTEVSLIDNPISDSTPLGQLTKLETIEISGTQITDFSFLSGLPDLSPTKHLAEHEWTTESPAGPRINITDKYPVDTGVYTIQNPFKDADGNLIAPVESEKYSYDAETGEIAVSASEFTTYIYFPYTYTTEKGEQLEAKPSIALELTTSLEIITQPADVTVKKGESVTLEVEVFGPTDIRSDKWQWYKDGESISAPTLTNTNYTSSLTISNATSEDAGSYYVVVTDRNGTSVTSESAEVTVTTDSMWMYNQPKGETVVEGNTAAMHVWVLGRDAKEISSYQWYKDGTPLELEEGHIFMDHLDGGYSTSNLSIYNAELSDAGNYYCVITDKYGNSITSESAEVIVTPIPLIITEQSRNVEIQDGLLVTLKVVASGSGTLSYQWYKDGIAISNSNWWTYSIRPVTMSSAGEYRVVVTDKHGSITSDPIVVTVTPPLQITKQPVGADITEGGSATLEVEASGSGTLSYQWYKGDTAISGAATSSLTISNAALSDAGSYTVVVTDNCSNSVTSVTSDSAEVTVTVTAKPLEITVQPQNISVTEGETATLTVSASGSGAISYQWYKDDKPIISVEGRAVSGAASSSLTISNATLEDAGSYTVVVTDKNGSVTSQPSVVTVTQKETPTVTETPSEAGEPTEAETPSEAGEPTEAETPSETGKPTETETPSETEEATETETPAETAAPDQPKPPLTGDSFSWIIYTVLFLFAMTTLICFVGQKREKNSNL